MNLSKNFCVKNSKSLLLSALFYTPAIFAGNADSIQFNTDVLDILDRDNIDLSQFARVGYIMPGDYLLNVKVNGHELSEHNINYKAAQTEAEATLPCLSTKLVNQFGLKSSYFKTLIWDENGCLDMSSLSGLTAKADLGNSTLNINIPQAYLEYIGTDWDPPTRWDNGVAGLLLDYNFNANATKDPKSGSNNSLTGNGTLGANWGVWRFRADWQLRNLFAEGQNQRKGLEWSRYYIYRALPEWRAKLTLGEDYLSSDIFDSFRFAGGSIASDSNMLPPALRGYAPEVTGVAESNATVIISQQGRVIYQTQVAAGPFRIQDLNTAISGTLDVEVQEQSGKVQRFQVSTASLPYLSRPGSVRYKIFSGRPTDWQHNVEGPLFGAGEISWGVSNGWSLYGGAIGSDGYQAMSIGVGRDLYMFGAIATDVTWARSTVPSEDTKQGKSLRISYAKMFHEYNSQVTFAGYRFSDQDFYSMSEYLSNLKGYGSKIGNNKERYVVSVNKQFPDARISTYLNYTHQSYWNRPATNTLDLTLSTYFDAANLKNISASLRGYRQSNYGSNDNGVMLSLNIPWGDGYVNYNGTSSRKNNTQTLGYSGRTDDDNSYSIRTTANRHGTDISGYYGYRGNNLDLGLSGSSSTASRYSAGLSLNGGMTLAAPGVAIHSGSSNGGTRLMVDTDGVAGVPVQSAGRAGKTNTQGLAVMTGVSSYHRTQTRVSLDKLADNVESIQSVAQLTLTEGAIGYRKLGVVSGQKGLVNVRLQDGSAPPFGATIFTAAGKKAGLVGDDGQTWLSGMNANEKMQVRWNSATQCEIDLPSQLNITNETALLLTCNAVAISDEVIKPINELNKVD
ncbi:fimbria/pilus outer membrane usher protein [Acinetobacter vivianii]|uniref:Fimbria/pilus outer membrane usher protein n=1 Tax=Acinetobacter vivianii TaxID=1776742 RepID=A0AAJ6NKD5_9GAMM|nr:fimbria/pilus outer membrane usher protein [Acinetobacter vivianii]WDZ51807.1 fimbria/pilus outer membrane usher protein [Acinetobacter vivianii]